MAKSTARLSAEISVTAPGTDVAAKDIRTANRALRQLQTTQEREVDTLRAMERALKGAKTGREELSRAIERQRRKVQELTRAERENARVATAGRRGGIGRATGGAGRFASGVLGAAGLGSLSGLSAGTLGLAGAGALVGGAGVAAGRRLMALSDQAVATADFADRLGAGVGQLQAMQTMGRRTGAGASTVNLAMQRLVKRVGIATRGGDNETARTFERIGIAATELRGLALPEMFGRFSEAVMQLPDASERVDAVAAVLDSEGVGVLPMMEDFAKGYRSVREELARSGVLFDDELVSSSREFQEELDKLQLAFDGLVLSTKDLIPVLTEVVKFTSTTLGKGPFTAVGGVIAGRAAEQTMQGLGFSTFGQDEPPAMKAAREQWRLEQRGREEAAKVNPRNPTGAVGVPNSGLMLQPSSRPMMNQMMPFTSAAMGNVDNRMFGVKDSDRSAEELREELRKNTQATMRLTESMTAGSKAAEDTIVENRLQEMGFL